MSILTTPDTKTKFITRDRKTRSTIVYNKIFDTNFAQYYQPNGNVDQTKWKQTYALDRNDNMPLAFWYRWFSGNYWSAFARGLRHSTSTPGYPTIWELQAYRALKWLSGGVEGGDYIDPDVELFDENLLPITLLPDGNLRLRARPSQGNEKAILGRDYVSGMVTTMDRIEMTYGYWEVRAKLGTATPGKNLNGMFPAIWLVGKWDDELQNPEYGPFECTDMNNPFSNSHAYLLKKNGHPYYGTQKSTFEEMGYDPREWNTYSVEWTPETIAIFVNDTLAVEAPNYHTQQMALVCNVALWDSNPDSPLSTPTAPDENTDFDNMYMDIEYIRIFESPFITNKVYTATNPEVM